MYSALLFLCFIYFINAQQDIGDVCTLESTGKNGKCVVISDCASAINDLKNQIFPQTCGYRGTMPIVCCPGATPIITTTATTTTTTTTTTRATTTTKPVSVTNRIAGETAKTKCVEYGKYVYTRSRPPVLLLNVEETVKDECGFRVTELIVGGELAKQKEFPHMAILGYGTDPNDLKWICGGSIISDQYILTAGHCVYSRQVGEVSYVKVGTTDLTSRANVQIIKVDHPILHPSYIPSSIYNDIALLKLERKIRLNGFARPACLFTKNELPTQRAIATGWGKTQSGGDGTNNLMKVKLEFFSATECNESFQEERKLKRGIDGTLQLCAGSHTEEKDTCQGDSGGPLQIYHTDNDVKCMYDIVGVTSAGKTCGLLPAIYTRVSHYIKWIEDEVWPEG